MNSLDRTISFISPSWALERVKKRKLLSLYEAARPSRTRSERDIDFGSADFSSQMGGHQLMIKARELEQNYDIASGALDIFVARIIGGGLQTEPLIKDKKGQLLVDLNQEIKGWWLEWMKAPTIDGEMSGWQAQQLSVRTWIRDGGFLLRLFEGKRYPHHTQVPLSFENIEYDLLPYENMPANSSGAIRVQGIEKDKFGVPVAYWILPGYPTELAPTEGLPRRIPANQIVHFKLIKRFNQTRGVTGFHPVFTRLADIRDYDDSERVAAKMAASIGAQLITDKDAEPPQEWSVVEDAESQATLNLIDKKYSAKEQSDEFYFKPGMFFDQLNPGQRVEMISSDRPSSQLSEFRRGQLRMVAAGLGLSYSSLAREYAGSYSSERQALVDSYMLLNPLTSNFVHRYNFVYERFVKVLFLYDLVSIPESQVDSKTLFCASHKGPAIPWIDPMREAKSKETTLNMGLNSRSDLIRQSGRNPNEVDAEIAADQKRAKALDLTFGEQKESEPPQESLQAEANDDEK